jgi:hypothetical protein
MKPNLDSKSFIFISIITVFLTSPFCPVLSQTKTFDAPNFTCEKQAGNPPPIPDLFKLTPDEVGYYMQTEINDYTNVSTSQKLKIIV